MNRRVAGLLGLCLGITAWAAPAAAQTGNFPTTVGDLSPSERERGQGRDGREVASGDPGESISYTIIETPDSNTGAATTAAPTTPAAPDLSRVPVPADSGETTVAPPAGEPAPAPIAASPEPGLTGDATTVAPDAAPAPLVVSCLDFGSWYDAQVYYESAGGLAAAPDLVGSLDPDADGVACAELIVYS